MGYFYYKCVGGYRTEANFGPFAKKRNRYKIATQETAGDKMENNLKKIRLEKHISLNECVKKTGISKQTLKRYERGKTTIGMEHILNLSELYGVSLDEIFDRKEKRISKEEEQ